jgi:undecaprenyl-diphosphatase
MIAIAAILGTVDINIKIVIAVAIVGAILGDGISFWIGRYYNEKITNIWPFYKYPHLIKKGENFFNKHGNKSIIIARFVGPVRPIVPAIAGMLKMSPLRFTLINVVSAVLWALAYILPGFFLGASFAVIGIISVRLVIIMSIVLLFLWILFNISIKIVVYTQDKLPFQIEKLRRFSLIYADKKSRLSKIFLFLFGKESIDDPLFVMLAFSSLISFFITIIILIDLLIKGQLFSLNISISHFFHSIRVQWVDNLFIAITNFGDFPVTVIVAIAILFILTIKRCHIASAFWILSFGGGIFIERTLKWILHLPRPIYEGVTSFGFPSGHVLRVTVMLIFLSILLSINSKVIVKWLSFTVSLLIIFLIALSRLYLGVNWLSDVLGGFFIGWMWSAILGILYLRQPTTKQLPKNSIVLFTVIIYLAFGFLHINYNFKKNITFYAPKMEVKYITKEDWIFSSWKDIWPYRIDLIGKKEQPMIFQFAGDIEKFENFLLQKGWSYPDKINFEILLEILSSKTSINKLPVLPYLHSGKIESLKLVKLSNEYRAVLRIWKSDFLLTDDNTAIYTGTIEIQKSYSFSWLLNLPKDTKDYNKSTEIFVKDITSPFNLKKVKREVEEMNKIKIKWDGIVLLIW